MESSNAHRSVLKTDANNVSHSAPSNIVNDEKSVSTDAHVRLSAQVNSELPAQRLDSHMAGLVDSMSAASERGSVQQIRAQGVNADSERANQSEDSPHISSLHDSESSDALAHLLPEFGLARAISVESLQTVPEALQPAFNAFVSYLEGDVASMHVRRQLSTELLSLSEVQRTQLAETCVEHIQGTALLKADYEAIIGEMVAQDCMLLQLPIDTKLSKADVAFITGKLMKYLGPLPLNHLPADFLHTVSAKRADKIVKLVHRIPVADRAEIISAFERLTGRSLLAVLKNRLPRPAFWLAQACLRNPSGECDAVDMLRLALGRMPWTSAESGGVLRMLSRRSIAQIEHLFKRFQLEYYPGRPNLDVKKMVLARLGGAERRQAQLLLSPEARDQDHALKPEFYQAHLMHEDLLKDSKTRVLRHLEFLLPGSRDAVLQAYKTLFNRSFEQDFRKKCGDTQYVREKVRRPFRATKKEVDYWCDRLDALLSNKQLSDRAFSSETFLEMFLTDDSLISTGDTASDEIGSDVSKNAVKVASDHDNPLNALIEDARDTIPRDVTVKSSSADSLPISPMDLSNAEQQPLAFCAADTLDYRQAVLAQLANSAKPLQRDDLFIVFRLGTQDLSTENLDKLEARLAKTNISEKDLFAHWRHTVNAQTQRGIMPAESLACAMHHSARWHPLFLALPTALRMRQFDFSPYLMLIDYDELNPDENLRADIRAAYKALYGSAKTLDAQLAEFFPKKDRKQHPQLPLAVMAGPLSSEAQLYYAHRNRIPKDRALRIVLANSTSPAHEQLKQRYAMFKTSQLAPEKALPKGWRTQNNKLSDAHRFKALGRDLTFLGPATLQYAKGFSAGTFADKVAHLKRFSEQERGAGPVRWLLDTVGAHRVFAQALELHTETLKGEIERLRTSLAALDGDQVVKPDLNSVAAGGDLLEKQHAKQQTEKLIDALEQFYGFFYRETEDVLYARAYDRELWSQRLGTAAAVIFAASSAATLPAGFGLTGLAVSASVPKAVAFFATLALPMLSCSATRLAVRMAIKGGDYDYRRGSVALDATKGFVAMTNPQVFPFLFAGQLLQQTLTHGVREKQLPAQFISFLGKHFARFATPADRDALMALAMPQVVETQKEEAKRKVAGQPFHAIDHLPLPVVPPNGQVISRRGSGQDNGTIDHINH